MFSSDNLSSVAYATEAILFTLLIAGQSTFWLALPISALIVLVLGIIVVSYRQTIRGYPDGGGSYIVARENLGPGAGMVAAGALLVDYVLTVAVSVAAGVAAITSAFPAIPAAWIVPISRAVHRARDARQPARRPRQRQRVRRPDVPVPRLDAAAHRRRACCATLLGDAPTATARHAARPRRRDARGCCS